MTLTNAEVMQLLDDLVPRYLPLMGEANGEIVDSARRSGEWGQSVENLVIVLSEGGIDVRERDIATLRALCQQLRVEMPELRSVRD